MTEKILSDEIAPDVKDDLLVKPNFPGGPKLKPRLPTRIGQPQTIKGVWDEVVYKTASDKGMIALRIPLPVANQIALPGGEPARDLHVTLVYLGDTTEIPRKLMNDLHARLKDLAKHASPIEGRIAGYGRFSPNEDEDVIWVGLDSPDLPELRHKVLQAVTDSGIEPAGDHGFTPHITLAYVEPGEGEDSMPPDVDVEIKNLCFAMGDQEMVIPLTGKTAEEDEKRPQPTAPYTESSLQSPSKTFGKASELDAWAEDKGALLVRADVMGVGAVVVKKGKDVSIGIEGWEGDIRLDDLVNALKRIDHDFIMVGRINAYNPLEAKWVSEQELASVFTAELVAEPIFFPADLLVLDGDLTKKSAAERFERMRALVPVAGSHVVVPPQIAVSPNQTLDNAVDEVMDWAPSEREKTWQCPGVTVVVADSIYTHGESADEVRLTSGKQKSASAAGIYTSTSKDFAFGAGPGAGTERPGDFGADQRKKPNFLVPETRESEKRETKEPDETPQSGIPKDALPTVKDGGVAGGTFGTAGTSGIIAPQQGMFRKPRRKDALGTSGGNASAGVPLTMIPTNGRKKPDKDSRDPGGPLFPTYGRPGDTNLASKSGPADEARDEHGKWTEGSGKEYNRDLSAHLLKVGEGLEKKYGVSLSLFSNLSGGIHLEHISVPKEQRSQGIGHKVMDEITNIADQMHKTITLDLATKDDSIGTTSRGRLVKFYRQFGFVENKGRKADYSLSASMYRRPETKKDVNGSGNVSGGGTGDGDSFGVGYGVVGGHTFRTGKLVDGQFVNDPEHPRVNPYEAIFQRKGVLVGYHGITKDAYDRAMALKELDAYESQQRARMDMVGAVLRSVGSDAEITPDILRSVEQDLLNKPKGPDSRKPRRFPDVGEDMGFNDTYDALAKIGWTDEAREAAAETRRRNASYPKATETIDGLTVRGASGETGPEVLDTDRGSDVDNMDSISATLGNDYDILDGIREVPMSAFEQSGKPSFYSQTEEARVKKLAAQIKESGEISPLIVVHDDKKSPYVLEGGHRFDALKLLGKKSFPALVVVDTSEPVTKAEGKSTIAIDFDGTCTINADGTENPKMRKLVEALDEKGVPVVIFSARPADEVEEWLLEHHWPDLPVTNVKSPDFRVILDDRAMHFDGEVPTGSALAGFKTWWEKAAPEPPVSKTVDMIEGTKLVVRHIFYGEDLAEARHMLKAHREADQSLDAALDKRQYHGTKISAVEKGAMDKTDKHVDLLESEGWDFHANDHDTVVYNNEDGDEVRVWADGSWIRYNVKHEPTAYGKDLADLDREMKRPVTKYDPDEARDESGKWSGVGRGNPKWTPESPKTHPLEEHKTKLSDANGEIMVHPGGQAFSGASHVQLAAKSGHGGVSKLLKDGWVRARVDHSSSGDASISIEVDRTKPDAAKNAADVLRANPKAEYVTIDPILGINPDDPKGPSGTARFEGRGSAGKAIRYLEGTLAKSEIEKAWSDAAREASAESRRRNAGGTAVATPTPQSSVDEWETRYGKPGNDPERYKVRMRDASGETLIHPNGDVYSGAPHAILARAQGMNVDEALGKGYVRGSDSWGGHVSAQFDLKNPTAQANAVAYLREHGKGSEIMVDDKMPEDQRTMPASAYFTEPAALGKALRYIQSGGTDRSEVRKLYDPSEPRDDKGQWTESPSGGLGDAGSGDHPEVGTPFIKHMPEEQGKSIVKYEAELLKRNKGPRGGEGTERMVIVRPDGDIALDKEGEKHYVPFSLGPGGEVERIKSIPGCVGTHNHPIDGGFSLSPADIATAGHMNLAEIRAVGNDYTFSMKPIAGKKWPNQTVMQIAYDNANRPLMAEWKKHSDDHMAEDLKTLDRKSKEQIAAYNKKARAFNLIANAHVQHETWLKAAPLLGLHYTRVARKKSNG